METVGRALGSGYELETLLGSGAMGDVWRALERSTGTAVAAKVLKSEYCQNPDIVARFVQERSILLALDHPGIVRVRDLVVERDSLAIVMDLVDGTDLRGALREAGTFTPARAAAVTAAVLEGLAAAHSQGALHRDVKPDNVLLTRDWTDLGPGDVRLSDFSIARLAQESTVQATGLLGTPEYMPPELFESGTSSAASDVYASGVLLYELLAGRTPFAGPGTAFTIGNRAVTSEAPELAVPAPLWQLLSSMIAKDPRRRPKASSAAESLRALVAGLEGEPALPLQPTPSAWQRSGAAGLVRAPIRPADQPAAFDVGGTNLDVTFTPEEQHAASGGDVRALAPAADPVLDPGVTNVGLAPSREYVAPALAPAADLPEEQKRSRLRTALLAGGAVALVAALVVGFLVLRGGDDESAAQARGGGAGAAPASVESRQEDERVEGTGLQVARTAAYDPDSGAVEMKVELSADRAPLSGPVLQVVPPARQGGECPLVAWSGVEAQKDTALTSGITAPCSFRLQAPDIAPGETLEATASFSLDLGSEDPQQALDAWLAQAAEATTTALTDTAPTNPAYPLQRLEGVEVTAPQFATTRTGQLRVVLHPRWLGGEVDTQHPLYDSTKGETSELLDQVAGGLEGIELRDGCDGALSVRRGLFVSVLRQSDSCRVEATVGNLTDLESNTFQIAGLSR